MGHSGSPTIWEMSLWARRVVTALALAVALGAVGGLLGAAWYAATGAGWGQFGYEFEGLTETLRGALAGSVTGALVGWFLPAVKRGRRNMALLLTGSAVAAALLVVGVSYLGDFTNSEGPVGVAPVVGILCIPASLVTMTYLHRHIAPLEAIKHAHQMDGDSP